MKKSWKSPLFSHCLVPCDPFLAQAAFKIIQNELCWSVPSVCVVTQRCPGKLCREPLRLEVGRRATQAYPHAPLGPNLGDTGPFPWQGHGGCRPASVLPPLPSPLPAQCLPSQARLRTLPSHPGERSPARQRGQVLRCRVGTPEHAGFRLTATWHRAGRGPFCVAFWLQPWPVFLGAFALPRMSRRPHCALRMFGRLVLRFSRPLPLH